MASVDWIPMHACSASLGQQKTVSTELVGGRGIEVHILSVGERSQRQTSIGLGCVCDLAFESGFELASQRRQVLGYFGEVAAELQVLLVHV